MTKTQAKKDDYLDYLNDFEDFANDNEGIVVPASFNQIDHSNPNPVEIDGVMPEKDKFCCVGFPEQNVDSFLFIPLYINALYRIMYMVGFDGSGNPPDCQSLNGMNPVMPLRYRTPQGGETIISECSTCPLYGFGRNFLCHNRPALVGLAYFPDHDDMVVPVRKNIPGLSVKDAQAVIQQLTRPVRLSDGQMKTLPYWLRLVRVFNKNNAARNQGGRAIAGWGFDLLTLDSPGDGPKFVPPHLLDVVKQFRPLAFNWLGASPDGPPRLDSGRPVAGHLPGGPEPQVQRPVGVQVASAEEKSDY